MGIRLVTYIVGKPEEDITGVSVGWRCDCVDGDGTVVSTEAGNVVYDWDVERNGSYILNFHFICEGAAVCIGEGDLVETRGEVL